MPFDPISRIGPKPPLKNGCLISSTDRFDPTLQRHTMFFPSHASQSRLPAKTPPSSFLRQSWLVLILLALMPSAILAQGGPPHPGGRPGDGPDKERLQAIRTAFLTEKLSLTPEEAAVFWPVFNQFDEAREQILEGRGEQKPETLSDAELEAALLAEFERQEKMLALNRQYLERFKEVLPDRKATMVFMLEHRFREEVLNAMRRRLSSDRFGGGSGTGPGGRFGGPDGSFAPDGNPRFKRQPADQQ